MNTMAALAPICTLLYVGMPQPPAFYPSEEETGQQNKGHANVEVFGDVGWIGPGQTSNIIVLITPDDSWHVYWKNPGASGAPTVIEIDAPDGYEIGEPLFPRPTTFRDSEGLTYGYNNPVAIFIPVTAPDSVTDGQVTFQVTTLWLACNKVCVMGEKEIDFTLSVNSHQQGPIHRDMRTSRWMSLLPRDISDLEGGECDVIDTSLHIIGISDLHPVRFIGVDRLGVRFGNPEIAYPEEGGFRLTIPLLLDFSLFSSDPMEIEGLLLLGRKNEDPSFVVRAIAEHDSGFNAHKGD